MHFFKMTAAAVALTLPLAGAAHAFGPVAMPSVSKTAVITVATEAELRTWVRNLRQQKLDLEAQVETMRTRDERLRKEVEALRRQSGNDNVARLRETVDTLKAQNERLRDRADKAEREADRLRKQLAADDTTRLRNTIDRLQEQAKADKREIEELRVAVRNRGERADKAHEKIDDLQERIERLQKRANVN